ncbi:MAG: M3 family metallopeptidase [Rikenellaceae bacterium]|nr:M3 family metallopeptidase [Rikenellaceae bacterium]
MDKQQPIRSDAAIGENPLYAPWLTPYGVPPFDRIGTEDYLPAFGRAMDDARAEVEAIASSSEAPTFANTIEALERKGERLNAIATLFFNLNSAETSDRMQEIALEIGPRLTGFSNDISLDERLFARVKAVYDRRDALPLDTEQRRLLDETYTWFTRSGAALPPADKQTYRELTAELSELTLRFGQNVLADTNDYFLHIAPEQEARIASLPGFVREGMAQEAAERGLEGWVVTLQAPSYLPFLTYSTDRPWKEELWRAYNSRGHRANANNNEEIVRRIVGLRLRIARLMGYPDYAAFVLGERMAERPETVERFLHELLDGSKRHAEAEYEAIRAFAAARGHEGELMPWDFAYYSEKYKNEHYNLSQEEIKPYFKLENVRNAVFLLAGRLYGLTFRRNAEVPVYHPDVEAYEVYDGDGTMLALLYLDFFPRSTKRGGAWMTSFRETWTDAAGARVLPVVSLCCNFTKPTPEAPSLLTFDEVTTLLHEFGHALHGMLAEGRYASLTGTNVYQDFVELPSQIMENWATEQEFLDLWAVHYKTGEKMPAELVAKIVAVRNYLAAYLNVRQLTFGICDMAWHTVTAPVTGPVDAFEREATRPAQLTPPVEGSCISTAFGHIFAGGYAAGYYSYKWAEVLEADAFELFRERGIFDREVAASFRRNILARGGTEHPMALYERFRGHRPGTDALFRKMGIAPAARSGND